MSSNTMTLLPLPPLTLMIVWKEGHGERGQGDVIKINSLKIKTVLGTQMGQLGIW